MKNNKRLVFWGVVLATTIVVGIISSLISRSAHLLKSQESSSLHAVKLLVDQEGIYEFSLSKLPDSVLKETDPENLILTHLDEIVPLWIISDETGIKLRFYGKDPDSYYSKNSIYILKTNSKNSKNEFSAPLFATPMDTTVKENSGVFLTEKKFEENNIYSPHAPVDDPWFWKLTGRSAEAIIDLSLPGLVKSGNATIELSVWSNTQANATPDHRVVLFVNDQQFCEQEWDGAGNQAVICDFPVDYLMAGTNVLKIEVPGLEEVPAEIIYLNWIKVVYPSDTTKETGQQIFEANGKVAFDSDDGLINIYDVTLPGGPEWVYSGEKHRSYFEGVQGHRYISVYDDHYLPVSRILDMVSEPKIIGADYLLIGDADLISAAKPLVKRREGQGLRVAAISSQSIFDNYGAGYSTPEAIRVYIKKSMEWDIKPRYILLLGDGSYDPRGYVSELDQYSLPTFFVFTEHGGFTPSDIPFGDVNDDGIPDISVGRLPARTVADIQVVIQKIEQYEDNNGNFEDVLLIADGQEFGFAEDARSFGALLPNYVSTHFLTPRAGDLNTAAEIVKEINNGSGLIAYFGHGSIQMWGKDKLFSIDNLPLLNNKNQYPLFINMTCLTGYFAHPKTESLSEALLWTRGGGAVAILGPTSLTLAGDQAYLSQSLAHNIFISERIGDAVLASWQQIPVGEAGARDVLNTFLLFGDPGMVLPYSSNISK